MNVSKNVTKKVMEVSKIYKLPHSVQESIPYVHIYKNGIIETEPGAFTKSYPLEDVNFKIAPDEEQANTFVNYMEFLNSFDSKTKWQICIHNHTVDKKETLENIRIKPQLDGLNPYRQEMNAVLLDKMSVGKNSIKQSKYLTVAVEDETIKLASERLSRIDLEVSKSLKKITHHETKPFSTEERLHILHDIYNTGTKYPFYNSVNGNSSSLDLEALSQSGLTSKDMIGPDSFDFSTPSMFKMGETFGQVLYLKNVPTSLSTDFIADISELNENLIISISYEGIDSKKSIELVRSRLASIEAEVIEAQSRAADSGAYGYTPPELSRSQDKARELMDDIIGRDQKLFLVTVTIAIFADDKDALKKISQQVMTIANRHVCPVNVLRFQQEFGFNTTLPLCRNDLFVERLHTTESASVFIPFTSQEIVQKDGIFYGLNQTSNNMILANRLMGKNFNALIFGGSGSGKSFTAKCEMVSVLLNRKDSQVFVIDPQGEYEPMTSALKGSRIRLAPGSNIFINPLDLDISDDEDDPITSKSDFVISMIEIMLGPGRSLEPAAKTIIDDCVRKIYGGYLEHLLTNNLTCDISVSPTLTDLYQELMRRDEPLGQQIARILGMYTTGSFNSFSRRTNVDTGAKFIVYDIKKLGTGMRELGLFICLSDILNKTIENAKKGIYTWFYIDEFHLLLKSDGTTSFIHRIWKTVRKWKGVPTGITQNTEDLLYSKEARDIFNNTSFIIMLSLEKMDRDNLAELLNLSDAQLQHITNNSKGAGLLYNGKIILPFEYSFPKDTKLYEIMNTTETVAA